MNTIKDLETGQPFDLEKEMEGIIAQHKLSKGLRKLDLRTREEINKKNRNRRRNYLAKISRRMNRGTYNGR